MGDKDLGQELLDQINDMNDEGEGEGAGEVANNFEDSPAEAGSPLTFEGAPEDSVEDEEAVKSDTPVEVKEDAPPTEEPVIEEPSAAPDPVALSEIEQLKAQIESLTGVINDLTEKSTAPPEPKDPDFGVDEILANMDFDEILESKEHFTQFMGKLLKAVGTGTINHVQGVIPGVINQHESMAQVRNAFYEANPSLAPVKGYVTTVANTIAQSNPEWSIQQVLAETAKVSKAALKLSDTEAPPPHEPSAQGRKPGPVLPGGTGRPRTKGSAKSEVQKQIDEMNDDMY